MFTWKKVSELFISKVLRIGKGASIIIHNADGTESTINLSELAALDGIAAADLAKIDGITNGTGAAGKALVLDSSGNVAMPATGAIGMSRAALAAAGTDATNAAAIVTQIAAITGADGTTGVALPAASVATGPIMVINTVLTSGANLKVYPVNGGNDAINGGAEDAAFTMGPGKAAWFIPTSATQWYVEDAAGILTTTTEANILDGVTAAAAELNYLDITTLGTVQASKAVTADSNLDITGARNVTGLTLLDSTSIETANLKAKDGTAVAVIADSTGVMTYSKEVALDGNTMATEAGAGITGGTGTVYKSSVVKVGGIIRTAILIDLTGLSSSTTDLDIIGQGASAAHLGQITAARNGTILTGRITCLEAPVGGIDDIDLYSATEGTGVFDGAVGDLTETALLTAGSAWTLGEVQVFGAVPAANEYLYLTGGAGGTAAAYTAGKFLIEMEGYDA